MVVAFQRDTRSRRGILAWTATVVLVLGCIEPSGPSARLMEPRVVFVSVRDGNEEIYSMNSDGTNVVRLTNHPARDFRPVWSPDGLFVAFVSERDGNRDIYVMNPDGTGLRNLTSDPATDETPAWSPDASRIAFSSNRTGNFELWSMRVDGTLPVRMTDHFAPDSWPSFSRDGRYVAFHATRNSINDDIYVLRIGDNQTFRLTVAGGTDAFPMWSPDGTKIVFTSFRDGNFEIYTMDFDERTLPNPGPNQVNLTNHPGADGRPWWSANGRQICWFSNRSGNDDIWVMNADGSNPVRLTTNDARDDFCSLK